MLAKKLRILNLLLLCAVAGLAAWLHSSQAFPWVAAGLSSVFIALVFMGSFTALSFLLATLYGSPTPAPFRLGIAGKLRTGWDEFLATMHTFMWRQTFLGDMPLASGSDPAKPALLLVHGFLCNRAFWTGFAREFAARGYAIDSVNLEPTFGTLDDYPAILHNAVQRLRAQTGQAKVVLIGHSMGGLAIRAYLRDYGSDAVRKAITIGTPHMGTWGAQLGLGKNSFQMRLNTLQRPGAWLNHLRNLESPGQDQLFEILFTHHDNIVFPQAIQTLGKAPVHEFGGMGHVQMVYAPTVRARIHEILARC